MKFITDMGGTVAVTDPETGETTNIGRYGVWNTLRRKPQCIDTSDDLQELQGKHGPGLPVQLFLFENAP
jgi:hypothetical protein